ncbi:hypothetical protein DS901_00055 [Loktanella sp. D2R18]|uniref:tetratricopeptide repeat protein n=1 Tax=Rhodobacterales TaxID=204455 RepID=UPI000DEB25B7|nr:MULTISPECIES: tetratricopeptide repeat protein [Rhodobacterales]RBW46366.1 hypothetical protein DS901_00055 [Loktanella sp. D2R18]
MLWNPAATHAQEFADILEADQAGDYSDAIDMLSLLAEQGDPRAQNKLGTMYLARYGGGAEIDEAVHWFQMAAEQGFAEAQSNLGFIYETGRGVTPDLAEAERWFRLAAEQGDMRAQANLGFIYENGRGVPQDDLEAAKWFQMAAELGDAYAQSGLKVLYETGRVPLHSGSEALPVAGIDWSDVDADTKASLDAALSENDLFRAANELPGGYLWEGFGEGCGLSSREQEIIQSLVYLRADVIPVVYQGSYGTHRHLKPVFEGNFLEAAHYILFDRADLVGRYRLATIVFNFYRQQIDEIPNRDEVLAEIALQFSAPRPLLDQVDENGFELDPLSIALSKLNLESYPNACLRARSDNDSLSLEDWVISFWVRRSVEGHYDFARQVVLMLHSEGRNAADISGE